MCSPQISLGGRAALWVAGRRSGLLGSALGCWAALRVAGQGSGAVGGDVGAAVVGCGGRWVRRSLARWLARGYLRGGYAVAYAAPPDQDTFLNTVSLPPYGRAVLHSRGGWWVVPG